jgi:myo-inositol 2-dehydrogenase / D-chiro-inositol 1-dehydrogenase
MALSFTNSVYSNTFYLPLLIIYNQLAMIIEKSQARPEIKVMVGFSRRFDADYMLAREKIKAGEIGIPIVIRSQGCELLDKSGLFVQYAKASGGIFVDTTIHDIDLTLSFFGDDSKPKSVWAAGITAIHKELAEFHDADNAVGVVEFWNGKIAYYYHSRTTAHGYDNATEIFGTNGKLSINIIPRNNRIEISDALGVRSEVTPSWVDRYEDAFVTELKHFTDAILDNTELPINLTTAMASLRIALGLQESLVTREQIKFDEEGHRITDGNLSLLIR